MKNKFWTVMIEDKFLNSNFMRDASENIVEAIRFYSKEECEEYFEMLRKDKPFRIVEVTCQLKTA